MEVGKKLSHFENGEEKGRGRRKGKVRKGSGRRKGRRGDGKGKKGEERESDGKEDQGRGGGEREGKQEKASGKGPEFTLDWCLHELSNLLSYVL